MIQSEKNFDVKTVRYKKDKNQMNYIGFIYPLSTYY